MASGHLVSESLAKLVLHANFGDNQVQTVQFKKALSQAGFQSWLIGWIEKEVELILVFLLHCKQLSHFFPLPC